MLPVLADIIDIAGFVAVADIVIDILSIIGVDNIKRHCHIVAVVTVEVRPRDTVFAPGLGGRRQPAAPGRESSSSPRQAGNDGRCFRALLPGNPISRRICHRFDLTPIRRIKRRLRRPGGLEPGPGGAASRSLPIPESTRFPALPELLYQDRVPLPCPGGIAFA